MLNIPNEQGKNEPGKNEIDKSETGKNETERMEKKTSKGYRLKISTHTMIKSLQDLTGNSADGVITQSCILLYKKILTEHENNLNS